MGDEILKLYNVGCEHCTSVCDEVFRNKYYAFTKIVGNTLYADVLQPAGIIPALHLIEHFNAAEYNIDNVIMSKLSEKCDFQNGRCEDHSNIKDISEWKEPNKKSYMVLNKRKNVYIEDLLNSYNYLLRDARKRGIKIEFPRDVIIKAGGTTAIENLLKEVESVPHIRNQPGFDLGLLEEDVTSTISDEINELSMYYITQKVRMSKGDPNG